MTLSALRVNWQRQALAVPHDEPVTFSWNGADRGGADKCLRVTGADGFRYEARVDGFAFTHVADLGLGSDRSYEWTLSDIVSGEPLAVSQLRTGLAEEDWHSDWIMPDAPTDSAPELVVTVEVPSDFRYALLSLAGVGIVHCTIGGRELESGLRLEPGFADLNAGAIYSTRDVTELLREFAGSSVEMRCLLGRGFFDMFTANVWRWHEAPWRGPLQLRSRLSYFDSAGESTHSGTGREWSWRKSRVVFDSFYEGETHLSDTTDPWRPVELVTQARQVLRPRRHEPVLVDREIEPVEWSSPEPGVHVADFGEVLAGNVTVEADDVTEALRVVYSERIGPDGRAAIFNEYVVSDRLQTDEFAPDAEGRVRDEALLSYKGFRYAEVSSRDRPRLLARKLHNALESVGEFSSSDVTLDWYDAAMRRTLRNNFHHIPTDSPTYEKNGWTGDVHFAAEAMLYQFDSGAFLTSWLDSIAASQVQHGPDAGRLPVIAPSAGWGFEECAPSPEWTTVYPYLVHTLACWYSDDSIVQLHREPVVRYLDYELSKLDDDSLAFGSLGDYNSPGSGGVPGDDPRMAASCLLVRALRVFAGYLDDATRARYLAAADSITAAVNRAFLRSDPGHYRGPAETSFREASNVLPVAMGLVPEVVAPQVLERIEEEIARRGNHHASGTIALPSLLSILSSSGNVDLAHAVMSVSGRPGIRDWMDRGHLTLLEDWEPEPRSHSHFFHGGAVSWLYRDVGGLVPGRDGWSRITISPKMPAAMEHARVTFRSPVGEWVSQWKQTTDAAIVAVSIPSGCEATVVLPRSGRHVLLGEGEHELADSR